MGTWVYGNRATVSKEEIKIDAEKYFTDNSEGEFQVEETGPQSFFSKDDFDANQGTCLVHVT